MNTTTETTTLGAVAARQSVITQPLAGLLDAYGPDAACTVTRAVYPFGTYVLDITVLPAHVCWTDDSTCADCGDAAPSASDPTAALYDYWDARPISVLDDLVQRLTDTGHEDLAHVLHEAVLIPLDERQPRAGVTR